MTSPQDFERLSAYLDNALSASEKARLEARLAKEAELRRELDDLRQTIQALRTLPAVKPPRNFALPARQAATLAQPRQFFPALRLATSLALLALMVAFAGDFAASLAPAASPMAVSYQTSRNAAPAATLQPPAVAMMPATLPPTTLAETAAGSGGVLPTQAAAGAMDYSATAPSALPMPGAASLSATAPPVGQTSGAAPVGISPATLPAEGPITASVLAAAPRLTETQPMPAGKAAAAPATETPTGEHNSAPVQSTEAKAQPPAEATPAQAVETEAQPPTATALLPQNPAPFQPPVSEPETSLWRYVELGLALVAAALALATWLARKR